MPLQVYKYRALSPDGVKVRGVVEAFDEFEAVAKIKSECSIVLKIEPVKSRRRRINLNEPLWVSEKVLAMTASQFAILLRAGLPTVRAVEVIAEQTSDRTMKKTLLQVAADVSAGHSLAQSFDARGKKIPIPFIETIRAGEESGTLEQSFEKLSQYYEKSYKIKTKVRGALIYPIFLCILAVLVIAIVVTFAIPSFAGIITGGGGTLPLPTSILLGISSFLGRWWGLILAALTALAVVIRIYGNTQRGRRQFALIALNLPVLGRINVMTAASQFANTMATLLTAGLPITRALTITGRVMDNYAVGCSVADAHRGIEEGKRLGDVLRGNPYLPPLLVEMSGVGEESGALEETLSTIGAYYDDEVAQASTNAVGLLEPLITVVIGLVIGFIVIALYLPMFHMYDFMGT